eukprot:TRINITY_DN2965_c0_g1_i1.p1 TRINITY_DN2965_c0_g1~~TRINITY_DN2965_c0_g1_i1.p1  ORF type:complete len:723 (-),score=86.90 TRINITY_DN2965_c0_g1_i1:166-2295(-)
MGGCASAQRPSQQTTYGSPTKQAWLDVSEKQDAIPPVAVKANEDVPSHSSLLPLAIGGDSGSGGTLEQASSASTPTLHDRKSSDQCERCETVQSALQCTDCQLLLCRGCSEVLHSVGAFRYHRLRSLVPSSSNLSSPALARNASATARRIAPEVLLSPAEAETKQPFTATAAQHRSHSPSDLVVAEQLARDAREQEEAQGHVVLSKHLRALALLLKQDTERRAKVAAERQRIETFEAEQVKFRGQIEIHQEMELMDLEREEREERAAASLRRRVNPALARVAETPQLERAGSSGSRPGTPLLERHDTASSQRSSQTGVSSGALGLNRLPVPPQPPLPQLGPRSVPVHRAAPRPAFADGRVKFSVACPECKTVKGYPSFGKLKCKCGVVFVAIDCPDCHESISFSAPGFKGRMKHQGCTTSFYVALCGACKVYRRYKQTGVVECCGRRQLLLPCPACSKATATPIQDVHGTVGLLCSCGHGFTSRFCYSCRKWGTFDKEWVGDLKCACGAKLPRSNNNAALPSQQGTEGPPGQGGGAPGVPLDSVAPVPALPRTGPVRAACPGCNAESEYPDFGNMMCGCGQKFSSIDCPYCAVTTAFKYPAFSNELVHTDCGGSFVVQKCTSCNQYRRFAQAGLIECCSKQLCLPCPKCSRLGLWPESGARDGKRLKCKCGHPFFSRWCDQCATWVFFQAELEGVQQRQCQCGNIIWTH